MAFQTTDGSKSQYRHILEATAGLAPAAGVYSPLRTKVGVKADFKRDTFVSKERRADRQQSGVSYGNKSGSGSLPVEWSYGSFEDIMEAVLGGTWAGNVLKIGNTVRTFTMEEDATDIGIVEQLLGVQYSGFSMKYANNAITEGDVSFIFRNIHAPQTKGVNLAYDSAAKTITRATAGFITVDGWAVGDAVEGSGNADAGNNTSITGVPWVITALTDTVMTFTVATGIVTKASAAGIVLSQGSRATSVNAASTQTPFDSFTGTITEGGQVIGHVTSWDLKVEQAMQPNFACGSDAAQSVSVGAITVSGNLSIYYIDEAVRKKFINGTKSSLSLVLGSVAATKAYTIDMNSLAFTSNSRDDNELARIESCDFVATYNSGDASTIKITRTP